MSGSSNFYYQDTTTGEICFYQPDQSFELVDLENHERYDHFEDENDEEAPALIVETTVSQSVDNAIAKFDNYFKYEGCRVGKQLISLCSH